MSLKQAIEETKAITTTSSLPDIIPEVWSREMEKARRANLLFRKFAVVNTDLKNKPGDVVHIARYDDLSAADALTEGSSMTPVSMADQVVTLTPTEYGKAVEVSWKLLNRSFRNVLQDASELIGRAIAEKEDDLINSELRTNASLSVYAGGATSVGGITSSDTMSTSVIREALRKLENANVPRFDDGYYRLIIHPKQKADLLADSLFANAAAWTGIGDVLRSGGTNEKPIQYAGFLIYTTTKIYSANDGSGGATVYRALAFGKRAYAVAEKSDIKMSVAQNDRTSILARTATIAGVAEFDVKILDGNRVCVIYTA